MTFDEWWGSLSTREQSSTDRDLTKAAWQVSAMLMQERCAKACSTLDMEAYGVYPMRVVQISNACAEAIRALELDEEDDDVMTLFGEVENLRSRLYQERDDHVTYIGNLRRIASEQIATARAAGKRESAEQILSLLEKKPWNFGKDLRAYVEELK